MKKTYRSIDVLGAVLIVLAFIVLVGGFSYVIHKAQRAGKLPVLWTAQSGYGLQKAAANQTEDLPTKITDFWSAPNDGSPEAILWVTTPTGGFSQLVRLKAGHNFKVGQSVKVVTYRSGNQWVTTLEPDKP
jgi:hypothetical protein